MGTVMITPAELADKVSAPLRRTTFLANSVFVRVKQGRYGVTRKLNKSEYSTDADKSRTHAVKTILVGPEYKAIKDLDVKIRKFVTDNTLPSTIERGIQVLMLDNVEVFDNQLSDFAAERKPLVRYFVDSIGRIIERDAIALGTTFNISDYDTTEKVLAAFVLGWQYVSLEVPDSLQALSNDMYIAAKERMEQNLVQAESAMRDILRAEMNDLVEHLIDRLGTKEDGKKVIFRDSLTENFQDFFNSFAKRNITRDEELAKMVGQAQALLSGVDPESLRDQDTVRDRVRTSFEELKSQLDSMTVVTTNRQINIE
jgi:hypothetical protein